MYKYIRAMSHDRMSVRDDLRRSSKPLMEHLIKLYLFPNLQDKNHWRGEVYSFLNDVPLLKGKNKLPSYKFIYQEITGYVDMLEKYVRRILKDYKQHHADRTNIDELRSIILEYYSWLATRLSTEGLVDTEEVFDKLEELGL